MSKRIAVHSDIVIGPLDAKISTTWAQKASISSIYSILL